MMSISPCNCSICYQIYNNERSPLILIVCGHTFCKECLLMIHNSVSSELICPECKQITIVNSVSGLPKNRGLLDLMIYNEKQAQIVEIKVKSNEKLLKDYEESIKKLEITYNKILDEHDYLTEISDVFIRKEIDDSLDNLISIVNEYRSILHEKVRVEFDKINLIRSFKNSIEKYKSRLLDLNEKLSKSEKKMKNSESESTGISINKSLELDVNEIKTINEKPNHEEEEIKGEIEFIELYNMTLKNYSKEIYNPCHYFYINRSQSEKIAIELKKLLKRTCEFDECIFKYEINQINLNDDKKLLKEIQECCHLSNFKKLKFMFTHLLINPNFFFSDLIESFSSQTTNIEFINSNNSNNVNNNLINLAGGGNQRNNNLVGNVIRAVPSSSRNGANCKSPILNLNSCIQMSKEKNETNNFLKFLIDEWSYIPLKIESDGNFDVKFSRNYDWKINLKSL